MTDNDNTRKCSQCKKYLELDKFKSNNKGCIICLERINNNKKNNLCSHGIRKDTCNICSPCPHGKRRSNCIQCIGCPHGRIKQHCAECNPCPHGKLERLCRQCNPCPHGKLKHQCIECSPCPHGKRRDICLECNLCPHGSNKYRCTKCNPCPHGKRKDYCKECDPLGHLAAIVRSRIKDALQNNKDKRSIEYLGCTIKEFKEHISNQFEEEMSWDNYGLWEIDHIIPLKYEDPDMDETIKRLHYTNTQPLWKEKNMSKGNRYIGK